MFRLNRALLSGSVILLIAFNIFNILNFLFQFFMARMLTVSDYGVLATLFSVMYVLGVFAESIQIIITRYVSGEGSSGAIKGLVKRSVRRSLKVSLMLFMGYGLLSLLLSPLLSIDYSLLLFNGLFIFTTFLVPIGRGVLNGNKDFKNLGKNVVLEAVIKLVLGVVFIYAGWKVYGAVAAAIIGSAIAILFSFFQIGKMMKSDESERMASGVQGYSRPVFFAILAIFVFYSIDIIIARIVFSGETAGYYAIAAVVAKTIFIGTQPIGKAMFPLSARKGRKKEENLLWTSFSLLIVLLVIALTAFYFFPDLLIRIFAGRYIPQSSEILFLIGIAMSLVSISNMILLYRLSMSNLKNYWVFLTFILIEIGLLFSFSSNLVEFSIALIVASAIFLFGSILFFER